MKNRLILWMILLVTGFLLGIIPQYVKARRLQTDLLNTKRQIASCQLGNQLSQLRDSVAMLYFEATRRNYGTAVEYSNRFFNEVQQVANQTNSDPNLKRAMEELLILRNPIADDLSKGDAAVLPKLQNLLLKTEQNTRL